MLLPAGPSRGSQPRMPVVLLLVTVSACMLREEHSRAAAAALLPIFRLASSVLVLHNLGTGGDAASGAANLSSGSTMQGARLHALLLAMREAGGGELSTEPCIPRVRFLGADMLTVDQVSMLIPRVLDGSMFTHADGHLMAGDQQDPESEITCFGCGGPVNEA